VNHWPTPGASDIYPESRESKKARGSGGADLAATAKDWPTPASRDTKNAGGPDFLARKQAESTRGQPLTEIAVSRFSLQGQPTSKPGEKSSSGGRKLSPLFVAWLMGLPLGWTTATTNCVVSEMEWCRWLQRWRSELYGGGNTTMQTVNGVQRYIEGMDAEWIQ
jgi:hypothetical protein